MSPYVPPRPYQLIRGAVLVPPRVAALLEAYLRLGEVRVALRGQDREVDEVLLAWHDVALDYRQELASGLAACDRASGVATDQQVNPSSRRDVTATAVGTREVAEAARVTTAAVTLAAREGRLRGVLRGGRWWFESDDVVTWLAERERTAA